MKHIRGHVVALIVALSLCISCALSSYLAFASSIGGGGSTSGTLTYVSKTDYTPSYPTVGGSSLSNVTVGAAWYEELGDLVFVQIALTADVTTATGSIYVSLPVAGVPNDKSVGSAVYANASTLYCAVYYQDANTVKIYNSNITTASGSVIWASFWYRKA